MIMEKEVQLLKPETTEQKKKKKKDKYLESETVVFYGSWVKALEKEDEHTRVKLYEMTFMYGCFNQEPSEEDISINRPLWSIIRETIDSDKEKRRERVNKSRKAMERYREKMKNQASKSDDSNDFNYSNNSNSTNDLHIFNNNNESESNIENESGSGFGIGSGFGNECESGSGHVGERGINTTNVDLYSDYNNTSTTSNIYGDDGGGTASRFDRKKIMELLKSEGVDETWANNTFRDLEAQDFKAGKKDITDIVAFMRKRWQKKKKQFDEEKACEKYAQERAAEEESQKKRFAVPEDIALAFENIKKVFIDMDKDPSQFLNAFRLVGLDGKKLIIEVPTKATRDTYKQVHNDEFFYFVMQHMKGYDIDLRYGTK